MVHAASDAGAEYAKIQSMHSSELTHRERFDDGLIEGGKIKVIKKNKKSFIANVIAEIVLDKLLMNDRSFN